MVGNYSPSPMDTAGAPDMPTIAAAEVQLRADNRPVLFLDTCILLDIIRATLRFLGTHYVQSAIEPHIQQYTRSRKTGPVLPTSGL